MRAEKWPLGCAMPQLLSNVQLREPCRKFNKGMVATTVVFNYLCGDEDVVNVGHDDAPMALLNFLQGSRNCTLESS